MFVILIGKEPERTNLMFSLLIPKKYLLLLLLLVVFTACASAGITITKAKVREAVAPYDEVTSGYTEEGFALYFKGDANCSCSAPDLHYKWYFDDGAYMSAKDAGHVYTSADAGNRQPYLNVRCDGCCGDVDSPPLAVYVIDDIRVDTIGDISNPTDNGRLSFNNERTVEATALPAGVSGSSKIDWRVPVGTQHVDKANTASGSLSSLPDASWPTLTALGGQARSMP